MSLDKIQSSVIEVLREVQELCGRPWTGIEPTATPIGDLEGFDSLCSVEATVMIEGKLGSRQLEVDSLFISEDGSHALTVKEIAQRISKLLSTNGGKI